MFQAPMPSVSRASVYPIFMLLFILAFFLFFIKSVEVNESISEYLKEILETPIYMELFKNECDKIDATILKIKAQKEKDESLAKLKEIESLAYHLEKEIKKGR